MRSGKSRDEAHVAQQEDKRRTFETCVRRSDTDGMCASSWLLVLGLVGVAGCGEVAAPLELNVDAPSVDGPATKSDAPLDVPPSGPNFDIAYVSQWEIRNVTGVGASWVALIVNKSTTQSMDLSQLTIADVTDDNPTINFNFMILNPATYKLPPGQAGGQRTDGAAVFVTPFVSEPRFDTNRPTFDFSVNDIPVGTNATVNASAKVRYRDQQTTLTFRFNIVGAGASSVTIQAASRVSSGGF
jgi:hypothetical protein